LRLTANRAQAALPPDRHESRQMALAQRVEASLPLLDRTSRSIEEVATAVGFQTATTFRRHFTHHLDVAPSAYRRSFQGPDHLSER
jgi:transcriptional regulator GlxA family with amidase domain